MTAETRKALQQGAADIREHAYKYWGKDNAKAERLEAQAKILDVLALTKGNYILHSLTSEAYNEAS